MKTPNIDTIRYNIDDFDLNDCRAVYEHFGCAIDGFSCYSDSKRGRLIGQFIFNIYHRVFAIKPIASNTIYTYDMSNTSTRITTNAAQREIIWGKVVVTFTDTRQYNLAAMTMKYSDFLFFSGRWKRRDLKDDFEPAPPPNRHFLDAIKTSYIKSNCTHDITIGKGKITIRGSQYETIGKLDGTIYFMISDAMSKNHAAASLNQYLGYSVCALNIIVRHNNRDTMELVHGKPFETRQEGGKYYVCLHSDINETFIFEFNNYEDFDCCVTYLHLVKAGKNFFLH